MTGPRPPENRPPSQTPPQGGKPQAGKPAGMTALVQSIVDEQAAQKTELREAMSRPAKRTPLGPGALAVLVMLNIGAWVLFPPVRNSTGDARSLVEVERDLRVVLASVAGEIEIWRKNNNNAVPASLAQVGVRDTSVTYVMIDSATYEVRGKDKGISSSYRSNVRLVDYLEATPGIKR
jgi:hypothetical protein